MKNNLDPLYKWTGGKRKEIKIFDEFYPDFVKNSNDYTYVEPFFGAGAVYWSLEANKNIINDVDTEIINFLNVAKERHEDIVLFVNEIGSKISEISKKEKEGSLSIKEAKEERGKYYYFWREKDRNKGLLKLDTFERACRFFIVNQLAFNGMRRFNSKGEFNIPYGNYKAFNIHINESHINLLKNTEIKQGSYKNIMIENDKDNTFIFLDPPYTREFNEYSHDNIFGEKEQIELSNIFTSINKAKVMLIINKDDFTTKLYKNYIKSEYDLNYSTNIKNRYDNSVKHLIITNY